MVTRMRTGESAPPERADVPASDARARDDASRPCAKPDRNAACVPVVIAGCPESGEPTIGSVPLRGAAARPGSDAR
eukprot:365862-Chlamydomonas_euryale.AAC.4